MGEVGDCDHKRFAVAGFGLGGVEGEEDGFESREGRWLRGVDAGEVEAGEEGDEGEDYQAEVGVRGEEGVVEPVAEGIKVGTGENTIDWREFRIECRQ